LARGRKFGHSGTDGVHHDEPRLSRSRRGKAKGTVLEIEAKPMDVFAAIRRPPILKSNSDVVKKPIVTLRDRSQWPSNNDDHVEKEEGMVLVADVGRSAARFSTPVVNSIPLL
jgi:hypothetical protein